MQQSRGEVGAEAGPRETHARAGQVTARWLDWAQGRAGRQGELRASLPGPGGCSEGWRTAPPPRVLRSLLVTTLPLHGAMGSEPGPPAGSPEAEPSLGAVRGSEDGGRCGAGVQKGPQRGRGLGTGTMWPGKGRCPGGGHSWQRPAGPAWSPQARHGHPRPGVVTPGPEWSPQAQWDPPPREEV